MKEIQLTQGKVALVDDEDFEKLNVYIWCCHRNHHVYYVVRNIRRCDGSRGHVKLHREIMNPPIGYEVDHINGDGLDNQKSNLRIVTHRENAQNLHMNKKSKFPGVTLAKRGLPWVARARINGITTRLGAFKTEEEAHEMYVKSLEKIRLGEPLVLNKRVYNRISVGV